MTSAAAQALTLSQSIERLMREDRGRLMAALISRLRDFQLAEDALQEAALSAVTHWGRAGLPASPQGWLLRVALRKAIDRLRGAGRDARKAADLARLAVDEADDTTPEAIPDDRLRLIFTCCHPALEPKTRVALTLRTIAGLSTAEIARAFLDTETAMTQRLTRAKTKLRAAGIPYAVPDPADWPERMHSVLAVVYLIFNAGYTAGPDEPRDLCAEAIYLARLIAALHPGAPEVEGCLALMLITHARRAARSTGGVTVPLTEQDRSLWDLQALAEGRALIEAAMARRAPGPYQIKAAIAACQTVPPPDISPVPPPDNSPALPPALSPDWPQIAALYDALARYEPTPVVHLNRAVALAETGALQPALDLLQALAPVLADYQPYHAALAEYLTRAAAYPQARAAYDRAIALAASFADAAYLSKRRDALPDQQANP